MSTRHDEHRLQARRRGGSAAAVAVTVMFVLTSVGVSVAIGIPAGGPVPGAPPVSPPTGLLCTGHALHASYVGSLVVAGTSPHPSVSNRTIAVSYYYSENYTPTHGASTLSCTGDRAEAITDSFGGFTLGVPIPTTFCNSLGCSTFSGPFSPDIFSVVNGTPSGYLVSPHVNGTTLTISYVEALSSVTTSPSSRITVSVLAPTPIRASAQSGNGSASPALVRYVWQISGVGWSVQSGGGTSNLTIFPLQDAGPGELALWVNGTFNGTAVSAPESTLFLSAAATTIAAGSVVPTALDAGVPTDFTISGSGAVGYAYASTILPGLGMANISAPCESTGISGDVEDLTCSASTVYTATGTTQPSANLSNGYSTAVFQFQPVSVASALGISVTPSPFSAYVGSPTPLSVGVIPATGTSPFGPACMYSGNGQTECDPASAGPFLFSFTYGSIGTFDGRATLVDRSGANVSTPFVATIVNEPALNGIHAPSDLLGGVGDNVTVTDELSGGAFPASYWWNESPTGGTLFAGSLEQDGSLVETFTARYPGPLEINLTVVDHLGTSVHDQITLFVNGSGPSSLDPVGLAGTWTTTAGVPYGVDWQAESAGGILDTSFSETVIVTPLLPGARAIVVPLWINASTGPVSPDAQGRYSLGAADWRAGTLEFTIDIGGVVPVALNFASAVPLEEVPNGTRYLTVVPDVVHEVLSNPDVVDPGARSNHTLYDIADVWGDPVPSTDYVLVEAEFPGTATTRIASFVETSGNRSLVWVNFSAPSSSNGTISVFNPNASARTLLEIHVPAGPSASLPTWTYGLALGLAAALVGAAFLLWRRRGPAPSAALVPSAERYEATEEELRRMAEGRAHVLLRSEVDIGHTLDELAQGLHGRPATPEELTEWVASLVADGSLRTALGDDGRSRFYRTAAATPVPAPRVELDDAALEAALRRRTESADDEGPFEPK